MVIQLYYFEELSLKEISEILEITESRISQIAKEVIKKLKDEGHTINVISSRVAPMFKTPYETTEKYLKKQYE